MNKYLTELRIEISLLLLTKMTKKIHEKLKKKKIILLTVVENIVASDWNGKHRIFISTSNISLKSLIFEHFIKLFWFAKYYAEKN